MFPLFVAQRDLQVALDAYQVREDLPPREMPGRHELPAIAYGDGGDRGTENLQQWLADRGVT